MFFTSRQENIYLDGFSFFRQTRNVMKSEHDHKLTRCPKLGDEINFAYCLREAGDLPCRRIIQCWFRSFDVESFLKNQLSEDEWMRFTNAQPENKVVGLLEIIEKSKRQK